MNSKIRKHKEKEFNEPALAIDKVADANTVIGKSIITVSGSEVIPISSVTIVNLSGGGEYGDVERKLVAIHKHGNVNITEFGHERINLFLPVFDFGLPRKGIDFRRRLRHAEKFAAFRLDFLLPLPHDPIFAAAIKTSAADPAKDAEGNGDRNQSAADACNYDHRRLQRPRQRFFGFQQLHQREDER